MAPAGEPTNLYYLVGSFLEKRGHSEMSRTYLLCSATSPDYRKHSQVLAVCALRERKIPIGPPREEEIVKP
ncbi:MAG TPA: hypothetical protein VMR25_03840 [Planctomycetaceae bacterium]|jgi:hypothetical protein|nr:hypothetical protein [Planctomycetaceae bacterium]